MWTRAEGGIKLPLFPLWPYCGLPALSVLGTSKLNLSRELVKCGGWMDRVYGAGPAYFAPPEQQGPLRSRAGCWQRQARCVQRLGPGLNKTVCVMWCNLGEKGGARSFIEINKVQHPWGPEAGPSVCCMHSQRIDSSPLCESTRR